MTTPPHPKDTLLIFDWNAKDRNKIASGIIGKFGPHVQNEAGKRLIEHCQENPIFVANTWITLVGQYENQVGHTLCKQTEKLLKERENKIWF